MKLSAEYITKDSHFWNDVNILTKETFPSEEYLAPIELVKISESENFDFLALKDKDSFIGFIAIMTYEDLAYLFFLAISPSFHSKGYVSRAIE